MGRTKDLIIRGGVNIAPAEIDETLLKHAAILDAAAVGVPDEIYGEEVVCYVVPRPDSDVTVAAVIAHCQASLPASKVPKQVIMVADLPKNDRGKVLRDKLRDDWNERMKLSNQRHSGARPLISGLPEISATSAQVGSSRPGWPRARNP
jgi:acyl-CoA synthetase (AMP-forming)/AMP-acid ligase II